MTHRPAKDPGDARRRALGSLARIKTILDEVARSLASAGIEDDQPLAMRVDKLAKQRDITQQWLDKFHSTCGDQAIQIMELRGELLRLNGVVENRDEMIAHLKSQSAPATDSQIGAAIMHQTAVGQRGRAELAEKATSYWRERAIQVERELLASRQECNDLAERINLLVNPRAEVDTGRDVDEDDR